MKNLGILALFTFFSVVPTVSQSLDNLIAYYSFENCDAKDVSLNNSDGLTFGDPTCDCGVFGNGLYLDGVDDHVVLAGNVEVVFAQREFTLSLYFRLDGNNGTYDIISKRASCNLDHAFAVRYNPSSSTLAVDMAESDGNRTSFLEQLEPGLCWINLVIVKSKRFHAIYVNSKEIARMPVDDLMDLSNNALLQIGNSPCVGTTDQKFKGYIDEIRCYRRVLDAEEIKDLYFGPDRIQTSDTTIYIGGTAFLDAGPSCTNNISWSPTSLVVSPNDRRTEATPPSTQVFTATYDYGNCLATDTVLVSVIDPSDIECGLVPIPNAFTPNNDGKNDIFFISNPFTLEQLYAFEIFDRLGNKVFSTTNVNEGWDGMYRGQESNNGLYLYKIRYNCQGKEITKSGSVMLIR